MFHKHLKSYQVIRQSSPALQTLWFINHLQEKTALMKSVIHAAIWNSCLELTNTSARQTGTYSNAAAMRRLCILHIRRLMTCRTDRGCWLIAVQMMNDSTHAIKISTSKIPMWPHTCYRVPVCSLHMLLMPSKNLSGTGTLESITVNLRYWFHINSQLNAPIIDIIFLWIVFSGSSIFRFLHSWL